MTDAYTRGHSDKAKYTTSSQRIIMKGHTAVGTPLKHPPGRTGAPAN